MQLKAFVDDRKAKILSNPIIQAGIYLDPRFRTLTLDKAQQENGKQVIRSLFIGTFNQIEIEEPTGTSSEALEIEDELEASLFSHHNSETTPSMSYPLAEIDEQLRSYEDLKFDNQPLSKLDVGNFWLKNSQNSSSNLNKLAIIALDITSVPVTEVTAERLFSSLNFVFNKHRAALTGDIVEDILFCRWNLDRL